MITYVQPGNLLESIEAQGLDGIMNAANGRGPMGAGIAGAIRRMGGVEIEVDAYNVCNKYNPQRGDAYHTTAGRLGTKGIKNIIHAVTMKNPGEGSSYEVVESAFRSAIGLATKRGISKLGCTALGTGVGGLNQERVADIMFRVAEEEDIKVGSPNLEIVFIDFSEDFISRILKNLSRMV